VDPLCCSSSARDHETPAMMRARPLYALRTTVPRIFSSCGGRAMVGLLAVLHLGARLSARSRGKKASHRLRFSPLFVTAVVDHLPSASARRKFPALACDGGLRGLCWVCDIFEGPGNSGLFTAGTLFFTIVSAIVLGGQLIMDEPMMSWGGSPAVQPP